ncbi:MAG TPA: amidohydrolase family protein [Clostridia bacterium]|mgnify:CR=1 FL=1|nr:amidohydrolase family protein [Clostridia bacterium]HOS19080.1 amidohydrolase family protein [Clostridia bacterium]HPK14867.1 amidohydrolase family protein [Clostridia bacterium]
MEKASCSLLVKDCAAVLPDHRILDHAAIAVDKNTIIDIGESDVLAEKYAAAQVLDGKNKLALPGMTDCHTHSVQQLLKGGTVDEPPIIWRRILVPYEASMNPEDRYHAARLYCIQALRAGITMFADAGSMDMTGTIEAAKETGMSAAVSRVGRDMDNELPACMCDPDADACMAHQNELFSKYNGTADGRIRVWYSLSSPMTTSRELGCIVADAAKKNRTGIHIHLGEHPAEVQTCLTRWGMRPPAFLDSCGVLGPNVIAAHCIQVTDFDLQLIAGRGVHIIHCPTANLPTQGIPKLLAERALGINIALGNDGASSAKQDLLGQAQLLKYVTQAVYGTPVFEPNVLPLSEAYDMCTINGARALGTGSARGTLEVGKQADIVLFDLDQPAVRPTRNLFKTFMMVAGSQDVCDLVMNGKVVIKDREFAELDEDLILFEGNRQLNDLLRRTVR